MVSIEIDGKKVEAREGQMIIEAADAIGVAIPRFCYHKKLSIAANCRMCLVDVANAPKALPACATPVTDGMKVMTRSERAVSAQKAVMEFLLINHPLDCPICDQGGQCELQDVALMYGKDVSRFTEGKRVVSDKDLGPLISTDMTRCIHCTRCVRFGTEVAGVREMGACGRGEFMQIGTYIEHSVDSELSGNIIDLCPVGALTSKPFRFKARAWELTSCPSVSPHDCIGSALFFHTYRGQVYRTLPQENEALNEVWLSDRDRFSYQAFAHESRLTQPMIKKNGEWQKVDWLQALQAAIDAIKDTMQARGAQHIGVLAGANSTMEEFYLTQKLFRRLGCDNLDHRLRQQDFTHQEFEGLQPSLGVNLKDLEQQDSLILIGSNIRKEQPIIAHRIRKATRSGAHVFALSPYRIDYNFDCQQYVVEQAQLMTGLLALIKALITVAPSLQEKLPTSVDLSSVEINTELLDTAKILMERKQITVMLGALALTHPDCAQLFYYSKCLATLLNAHWGQTSFGANGAGAWLAGMLPHRRAMGENSEQSGLNALQMFEQSLDTYVLMNCEPEFDCVNPALATRALKAAKHVVVLSAYENSYFRDYATVMLPISVMSEMSGTYVNALGDWQNFQAACSPLGESRPAWKVLRVLGNLLEQAEFSYEHVGEIYAEILNSYEKADKFSERLLEMPISPTNDKKPQIPDLIRLAPISLYDVDSITRRASALQQTQDAKAARWVKINSQEAAQRSLQSGQWVKVKQNGYTSQAMLLTIDDALPMQVAMVNSALAQTVELGEPYGAIELIATKEPKLC